MERSTAIETRLTKARAERRAAILARARQQARRAEDISRPIRLRTHLRRRRFWLVLVVIGHAVDCAALHKPLTARAAIVVP